MALSRELVRSLSNVVNLRSIDFHLRSVRPCGSDGFPQQIVGLRFDLVFSFATKTIGQRKGQNKGLQQRLLLRHGFQHPVHGFQMLRLVVTHALETGAKIEEVFQFHALGDLHQAFGQASGFRWLTGHSLRHV